MRVPERTAAMRLDGSKQGYRPPINMARVARFVVPGLMSRERGARRERVFFGEDDDALYPDLPGVAVFFHLG